MPTPEEEQIIAQFRKEMRDAHSKPFHSRHHYDATGYLWLLDNLGAEGTAIHLIDQDEITPGLIKLATIEMLDCSSEAIILRPKYRIPYLPSTPERREKARRKLSDNFDYSASWDDGQ